MRQALMETPEGQTFLPVSRLTEWFEGLTGIAGEWRETAPRMIDLAAHTAARSLSMEPDLEPEGQAEGEAPEAVPEPPGGRLADESDASDEPTVVVEPEFARNAPAPEAPPRPAPQPSTSGFTAVLRPPSPSQPVPALLPPPKPKLPDPGVAGSRRMRAVREYAPWVMAGLVAGSLLTWLIWKLG
jgi:hypothetical protein